MADNIMSAGARVSTDEVDGAHIQRMKLVRGDDGSAEPVTPLTAEDLAATQAALLQAVRELTDRIDQLARKIPMLRGTSSNSLAVDCMSSGVTSYPFMTTSAGNYAVNVDVPQLSGLRWAVQRNQIQVT